MKIIEYNEKYKKDTIELLIRVAVEEHGFEEWRIWFERFNNANYKHNNGNCWIALDENDKVIGTISLRNLDNISCELKTLYVDKKFRGNGIAHELMSVFMDFAKERGYKRVQLDTYDGLERAKRFYEKNGFKVEEKIEEHKKYIYYKILHQETISIIIPIYNTEKYLKSCVESIINQTYKNLEIILVDDGSIDKSGQICDEYSKKDPRIKTLHKPNGGLADARNYGLKNATGKYIGFIDGDDYIYPTFYEELHNLIKKHNADIAECQFLRIKEDDINKAEKIIDEENKKLKIDVKEYENKNALHLLYGTRLHPYVKKVVVWNKIYKRKLWEDMQFPVGKLHEDEFTTFKVLYNCKKIVSTNKILHGYMQTNNSIMRRKIEQKRIDDNLEAYSVASQFFKENNEKDIEMMSRRRYLENCIELSGKVLKEKDDSLDNIHKLKSLAKIYKEYYEKYMNDIISNNHDENAIEILNLLKECYEELKDTTYIIENFWNRLEIIVNKD